MCKIVYLTSRRFDHESRLFLVKLKNELESKNIEVVFDYSFDLLNIFKKHKTYGIAIAIDFYRDNGSGRGIVLNRFSSIISKIFAHNISNSIDKIHPVKWREYEFVKSEDENWYKFFNQISAEAKAIFYLCTKTRKEEYDSYLSLNDKIVKLFSDEIIRCLRSEYNSIDYQKKSDLYNRKNIIYQRQEHGSMDKRKFI